MLENTRFSETKILVVEDDEDINRLLCRIIEKNSYKAISAYSGTEAKLYLEHERFDLAFLDLMLPGMTGEKLVEAIRKTQTMPIIVISAKSALEDKVALLKLGADDYITKPFEIAEVSARMEAQLRRFQCFSQNDSSHPKKISFKNLVLDETAMTVFVKEQELSLTAREFSILELLLKQPNRVFTRENIYEQIWNGEYLGEDNTVNVHISNIRQKLQKADPFEEYIKTVWGIGFKMSL